uniref:Uncharacterized protein n=1 Tax=Octopus bimaculoides TaxID=37653 RepID=A0A0L8HAS1_OCTBM
MQLFRNLFIDNFDSLISASIALLQGSSIVVVVQNAGKKENQKLCVNLRRENVLLCDYGVREPPAYINVKYVLPSISYLYIVNNESYT